jgi:hypothetical protein
MNHKIMRLRIPAIQLFGGTLWGAKAVTNRVAIQDAWQSIATAAISPNLVW